MISRITLFLVLIALSIPSVYASEDALIKIVKDLSAQVEMLTARLQQLEQKLEEKEHVSSQAIAEEQIENKKVDVGDIKESIKIPGTDTSLAIGGYAKLDVIYNSRSVGGSGGSNLGGQILVPGSIPVQNKEDEEDQITFHVRQSRFWLKSFTPTEWGDLNTYLEMDFFAFQSPGDERVSNSYSPRLRHAFGSMGQFLAGQTWTTFMNVKALLEQNDFGGPVGRIFIRQPQIRWTQPIGDNSDWMVLLLKALKVHLPV